MKIGKVISVLNGPQRDVVVRISSAEVYSEISDPPGAILGTDVKAYDVIEERIGDRLLIHLNLQTVAGQTVRFYTAEAPFDMGLLLDELEASLGDKPRTWKKAENEQRERNPGNCGPGIGFLLCGMVFIVMVCLGYTFIPYRRFGGDRALEPWQMWGIGLLLIAMSIVGVLRQMRAAKKALILTATLKSIDGNADAEQQDGRYSPPATRSSKP